MDDPNGPNHGIWYVHSHNLKIDQVTLINKYIKEGGPLPDKTIPNVLNFFAYNNANCSPFDSEDFVIAVKNHEGNGSGTGSTGHFQLIRDTEALAGNDAATAIESVIAPNEQTLKDDVKAILDDIETKLYEASKDFDPNNQPQVYGNWNIQTDGNWAIWIHRIHNGRNYTPCDAGQNL